MTQNICHIFLSEKSAYCIIPKLGDTGGGVAQRQALGEESDYKEEKSFRVTELTP